MRVFIPGILAIPSQSGKRPGDTPACRRARASRPGTDPALTLTPADGPRASVRPVTAGSSRLRRISPRSILPLNVPEPRPVPDVPGLRKLQ